MPNTMPASGVLKAAATPAAPSAEYEESAEDAAEDETEAAESFELPGADLSHEELTVRVLPQQGDEFTCAGCFLVRHRSQIAEERANGDAYCFDCAG